MSTKIKQAGKCEKKYWTHISCSYKTSRPAYKFGLLKLNDKFIVWPGLWMFVDLGCGSEYSG